MPVNPTRKKHIDAVFLPIVKSNKLASFLKVYKKWFVLEETIEDAKTPGKLKGKFNLLIHIVNK